jgi:hypothetical protein
MVSMPVVVADIYRHQTNNFFPLISLILADIFNPKLPVVVSSDQQFFFAVLVDYRRKYNACCCVS